MADKEVRIKVVAEGDTKDIEDIEERLEDLKDQKLQLQLEADTAELEEVNEKIEETQNKLDELKATPEVDNSEIEALESELQELEGRRIDLEIAVNSAELDQAKSSMEDLENSANSTSGVLDEVGGAMAGIAAAAGLERMVTVADNINNSWRRVKYAFDSAGISQDQVKKSMEGLSEATGRTGGQMRDFYTLMGNSGIKNLDAIRQGFETVSAGAYKTGNDIGTVQNAVQRMVMAGNTGAMMLKRVGISIEDLAKSMGVSVDEVKDKFKELTPEERLNAINNAMSNSKQINDEFKDSFAALKVQAEAAMAGLLGAVGQAILPVIIPMLQMATQGIQALSNGFKALPAPVQSIIGVIAGLVLAGTTLVGTLGVIGKVLGSLKGGLGFFKTLKTCDKVNNASNCLKGLSGGIGGVISSIRSLGTSMLSLLANPYVLLIVAIVAIVAGLWYLYNTNEAVRQAFDRVGQALMTLWEKLSTALQPAIDAITRAWDGFMQALGIGGGDVFDAVIFFIVAFAEGLVAIIEHITMFVEALMGLWEWLSSFPSGIDLINAGLTWLGEQLASVGTIIWDTLGGALQWLSDTWNNLYNAFMTYAPLIAQILFVMATGGVGAIILLVMNFMGMPNQIGGALQSVITKVIGWISNLVTNFGNGAKRAIDSFLAPFVGLADAVSEELSAVYSTVMGYIQPIIDAFNALGSAAAWAFSVLGMGQGSPGDIYDAVKKELEWTTAFVKSDKTGLALATGKLGSSITNTFNPDLTPNVNSFNSNYTNENNTIIRLLNELIGVVRNNQNGHGELVFNHYGDVDTEERMEKILQYIQRALQWDNDTAGRNEKVL